GGAAQVEEADVDGVRLMLQRVDPDEKDLLVFADQALNRANGNGVAIVIGGRNFAVKVASPLADRLPANGLIQAFRQVAGGKGGVPSDIQGIIDSCDRAMSQAEDMCDTIPGQVVIGIAGELVKGFSTSVTVPRADPNLKINEVELVQTLQLVQKRALREASHSMSLELGVPDVNVKLINSAITSVRIDGFAVNNPIDFQGKQMVITVFNIFATLS